ncbi:MAG: T9SS type A sorting domain-containing protein [Bacteroidetes bacterium]|nr:T9SS type A sorting domain-containing protein [Bacteroidota bacterium]
MKKTNLYKTLTIIAFLGLICINSMGQDTLVQWTFPSDTGVADGGCIQANLSKVIETAGNTSAIQFKNGLTTKAAQATGWHNGADQKKWKVTIKTTGYSDLKLSSKISTGGANPGPRDFKVQYKVSSGSWTDVANSDIQTANNWTSGVLNNLAISNACDDKNAIQLRWIMTSDTANDGSIVDSLGTCKIDDIFITGTAIPNGKNEIISKSEIKIYPNPTTNYINIENNAASIIKLYNIIGEEVIVLNSNGFEKIDVSNLNSGIYLLKIEDIASNKVVLRKIIIQ